MKKIVFAFAFVAGVASVAQAQYRPEGGEKNIEVNFAPLGGNPVSISGIKLRSFSSQTSALRLGIFIGHSNSSTITQEKEELISDELDDDFNGKGQILDAELRDRKSSTTIALQPGIESHFAGTDRLSPYVGAFVNIGYTAKKDVVDKGYHPSGNPIEPDNTSQDQFVGNTTTRSGQLNLGLNGVAGFDYYIAQHLYLGAEVGFGFAMNRDLKNKTEDLGMTIVEGKFAEETVESESILNNKSGWQIGPNVVGQLRLGWLF
jgi:hypothetical protein